MKERPVKPLLIVLVIAAPLIVLAGIHSGFKLVQTPRDISVMGTNCSLNVVARVGQRKLAEDALDSAEAALRKVDARMSTYLADSELSAFNAAAAGEQIALSAETLEVLQAARQLSADTDGAFDVTCRGVIELWKQAAKANKLPTTDQLAAARASASWNDIFLGENSATKSLASAGVDLGGIAKGYGIDLAIEAMQSAGVTWALADVGGDIRCIGLRADGKPWRVGIRNPIQPGLVGVLEVTNLAVCTSGNYERFSEIGGVRYSHIVDPRTGWPAEAAPSVTVIAPTALIADAWATALSVLGSAGLEKLPQDQGVEAMIIMLYEPTDKSASPTLLGVMTDGFAAFLADDLTIPATVQRRRPTGQAQEPDTP